MGREARQPGSTPVLPGPLQYCLSIRKVLFPSVNHLSTQIAKNLCVYIPPKTSGSVPPLGTIHGTLGPPTSPPKHLFLWATARGATAADSDLSFPAACPPLHTHTTSPRYLPCSLVMVTHKIPLNKMAFIYENQTLCFSLRMGSLKHFVTYSDLSCGWEKAFQAGGRAWANARRWDSTGGACAKSLKWLTGKAGA